MSGLFIIPLNGLKEGSYSYDYEVSSDFFAAYEGSEIGECKLILIVVMDKLSGHYNMRFKLKGIVKVTCDRCLEEYEQAIDSENRLIVKTGEKFEDSDAELIVIPAGLSEFDLSQYIYDFAHLALPFRRIHPEGADGVSMCDPEMLNRIVNINDDESDYSNPDWDRLKELLHKN